MSPNLNLPEGEQKEEVETEQTVAAPAPEPLATIEEDTTVPADVKEKVTSVSPTEEAFNMEESLNSETKNIAAEISALLDEENEVALDEDEIVPTATVTLRNRTTKGVSEEEERPGRRSSCFLTEIDDNEGVDDEVFNPQDAYQFNSIVDKYLQRNSTNDELKLETENIEKKGNDENSEIVTEETVALKSSTIDAESQLVNTIEEVEIKATEEPIAPTGAEKDEIEVIELKQDEDIEGTTADVLSEIENATQDLSYQEDEFSIKDAVNIDDTEAEQTALTEDIHASAETATIEDFESRERSALIEDTGATEQTVTVEDIKANTVLIDETEVTETTAALADIVEEGTPPSTEKTESSMETADTVSIEYIESTEAEQTEMIEDIKAESASIEDIVAIAETSTVEDIEDLGAIEQNATIEDIKADTVSSEETEVTERTAVIEDIEITTEANSFEANEGTTLTATCEDIEAETKSASMEIAETAAQIASIEDIEADMKTVKLENTDFIDIAPAEQTLKVLEEDVELTENVEEKEADTKTDDTTQILLKSNDFIEDIKKEFNDVFDQSDKIRCNERESIAEEPLSPKDVLPLGGIAVATLVIFLALILFYN